MSSEFSSISWDTISGLFDPYDRKARLYPGMILVMPLPILVMCFYNSGKSLWVPVVTVLGTCGVAFMLASIARSQGKKVEDRLFAKWGGKPTSQLLRHRNTHFDIITKARYHTILGAGINKPFPSAQEEFSNPAGADEVYRAATVWLLGQTRDVKAFPLVIKENISYGFNRNMLGLRPLGIALNCLCLLWVGFQIHALAFSSPYWNPSKFLNLEPTVLIPSAASLLLIFIWSFLFTEKALKSIAFSFAERLFQASDALAKPKPRKGKTAKGSVVNSLPT